MVLLQSCRCGSFGHISDGVTAIPASAVIFHPACKKAKQLYSTSTYSSSINAFEQ
jgi:hypothetical protein